MNIRFNSNIANALVNGHPVPIAFVHQFVQEAYDTFQYAQKAFTSNKDYESNIKHLENELSVVKAALLDTEEELNQAQEKLHSIDEQLRTKDVRIKELEARLVEMKVALIDAQEELNKAKEDARIAQEQRNASNREIERLRDEVYALKGEDELHPSLEQHR